jgi:hypothetical protein
LQPGGGHIFLPGASDLLPRVKADEVFPSSSGSRAMLTAIRRASSFVSTLACSASASLSRE